MVVDVAQIKSCWVGESEKNIRKAFERYRAYVKEAERAPILLFNEADAVLGIRQEGASRAVEKMENSLQNIILQEMEQLDGIMIATTNLTQNLDRAFERRFLYKIEFERLMRREEPDLAVDDPDARPSGQPPHWPNDTTSVAGRIENIAVNGPWR